MCLALVDGKFRYSLLTDVADVVEEFELDPEERDVLKAIKAASVTEFAQKLYTWMLERESNNGHCRTYEPEQLKTVWDSGVPFLESTYRRAFNLTR